MNHKRKRQPSALAIAAAKFVRPHEFDPTGRRNHHKHVRETGMTEARYTPQTIYKALPDDQVATTGWREYFFEMAHAVVSGWGLVDQRAAQIMGLCVMADEAEDGLNRLTQQLQTVTERADEAERKLKGEQLSHGRTKKTVERLEKYIEELEQQVQEARDA